MNNMKKLLIIGLSVTLFSCNNTKKVTPPEPTQTVDTFQQYFTNRLEVLADSAKKIELETIRFNSEAKFYKRMHEETGKKVYYDSARYFSSRIKENIKIVEGFVVEIDSLATIGELKTKSYEVNNN